MKVIVPDYYEKFFCIADKCKHNCCVGWEIDIDEFTLEYYGSLEGEMGEELRKNICFNSESPHFCLATDERCPFLNENNLCRIITKLGEDALCDICADHPRFRNYFSDREEIGVGLCCESAAKLILENTHKVQLSEIDDDGENEELPENERELLALRNSIFKVLQNRERSIDERVCEMICLCGAERVKRSLSQWGEIYLSLERLDESWSDILNALKNDADEELTLDNEKKWEQPFEQLLHYFVFRHLAGAVDDGRVKERVLFAAESFYLIKSICALHEKRTGDFKISDLEEYCRMYSSEIEYSDENIEKLLDLNSK